MNKKKKLINEPGSSLDTNHVGQLLYYLIITVLMTHSDPGAHRAPDAHFPRLDKAFGSSILFNSGIFPLV